jgi:hypothetical protein
MLIKDSDLLEASYTPSRNDFPENQVIQGSILIFFFKQQENITFSQRSSPFEKIHKSSSYSSSQTSLPEGRFHEK